MTRRTTVRLPDELLRRAKKYAVAEGTTVTALMEDGLRYVLNERDLSAKRPRIFPPVDTSGGGLKPGYDEVTLAKQLQEEVDIEYVRRMNRGFR